MGQNRRLQSIVAFIIIALVFVGSGYLIGRFLLAGLLHREPKGEPVSAGDKTSPPSQITAQIQVKPITLYRVQIGAFANRENAEKIAEQALQKGVGAAVMSPDPLYKVYCGISGSKDAANKISSTVLPKLSGSIIAKDDKPYVASFNVESKTFNLTGDKAQVEKLQEAFVKSGNALEMLVSFWDGYYTGEETKVNLSSMEADMASLKQDLINISPSAGLKATYDAAVKVVSELEASIKAAREAQGGDGGKIASGMAAFIKCVDAYTQELKKLG